MGLFQWIFTRFSFCFFPGREGWVTAEEGTNCCYWQGEEIGHKNDENEGTCNENSRTKRAEIIKGIDRVMCAFTKA